MTEAPPPSWIRLWCDFLSNWKIASLPEPYQLRLVKLWLIHAQGHLVGATTERLAWELRLPVSEVQATLSALAAVGLLDPDGSPHGWPRRQPRSDHTAAQRQRQHRQRRRDDEPAVTGDVTDESAPRDMSRYTSRYASRDTPETCHKEKERKKEREERLAHGADDIPFEEIIAHLNQRAGSAYRATTKATQAHIRARWNEGHRLEDFRAVVDAKAAQWGKDPKWASYLRPETLFGPKFEGYLQAARSARRTTAAADDDLPNIADLMAQEAAHG